MKIVSLCKTHSCNIFLEAAIEGIYRYVDYIVFVNSNINWLGQHKKNECVETINRWKAANDVDNKIMCIENNASTQFDQCNFGYKFIRDSLKADWIHIFDTDEIWDEYMFKRLIDYAKYPQYNAICAHMYTYLKSIYYVVTPPEYCKPTVLLRPVYDDIPGTRGNILKPKLVPDDLFFHHYTYVRETEEEVFQKIRTTLVGDKEDVPQCQLVDFDKWKKNKWDKILTAKNLHTTKYYEKSWAKIKKIGKNELPQTLRNKKIIERFEGDL